MRKVVNALVFVPLAIIIVMFAVANRGNVTLAFDPFDSADSEWSLKLPLFLLSFALVAIGVLIGSFATWLRQRQWRARARRAELDARTLREQLAARRWWSNERRALPPEPKQDFPLALPPAA